MSAIVGLFQLNGQEVKKQCIEKMKEPILNWGKNGSSTFVKRNVGLGHLLSFNTPEAKFESLPLCNEKGNLILISRARIDNREELAEEFGWNKYKLSEIPDSRFILSAYEKWGHDCVKRILGDWAIAIWDDEKKEMFIARDHHGNTGLYYYHNSKVFAFSSNLKSLLEIDAVDKSMNELYLTKILVSWKRSGEETAFKNIFRLPPAHFIYVSQDEIRLERYWFPERTPMLKFSSDDQYYEHFMEVFKRAIRVRLRSLSMVGANLSGGLDSGSISVLAAEMLSRQNEKLQCFSSVPNYNIEELEMGSYLFGDETPFIQATAQKSGNIKLNLLKSNETTPLQGLYDYLEYQGEPGHASSNCYWIYDIMKQAYKMDIKTMLNGQSGNGTISWRGEPYAQPVDKIIKQGMRSGGSMMIILKAILHRVLPMPLLESLKSVEKGRAPWKGKSAINTKYAEDIGLEQMMKAENFDPHYVRSKDPVEQRIRQIAPGRKVIGSITQNYGGAFGIEVRDPTKDKNLIETCLAIPTKYYYTEEFDRYLIRRSMKDYLPEKVLYNRMKGKQAADVIWRIRADQKNMRAALDSLANNDLINHMIDLEKMNQVFESALRNVDFKLVNEIDGILLRGLKIGIFIQNHQSRF